jgi:hypothetical protein
MKVKLLYASLIVSGLLMALMIVTQFEDHFPVALPGKCVVFMHPSLGLVEAKILKWGIAKGNSTMQVRSPVRMEGLITTVRNRTVRAHGHITTECK